MYRIKAFERNDIDSVIAFETELRQQEPDTYYWEPDETYRKQLEKSFDDSRFNTAISFIAEEGGKVIGRIDGSLISSRSDACCCRMKKECRKRGAEILIALMAENSEAQRFYRSVENASIHDTAIWMNIK